MKYTILEYSSRYDHYSMAPVDPIELDQLVYDELYVQNTGDSMLYAVDEDGNTASLFVELEQDKVIQEMHESGMCYFDILRTLKV